MKTLRLVRPALALGLSLIFSTPAWAQSDFLKSPEVSKFLAKMEDAFAPLNKMKGSDTGWQRAADIIGIGRVLDSQESLRNQMDSIMLEASELLGGGDLKAAKQAMNEAQKQIASARKDIASYELEKVSAPTTFDIKRPLTRTVKKLDEFIAAREDTIKSMQDEIAKQRRRVEEILAKRGIKLSKSQLDAILNSATSEGDLRLFASYNDVKALTAALRASVDKNKEKLEVAKKYYGMHTLLLRMLVALHQDYIARIDKKLLPELAKLKTETQGLITGARTQAATAEQQSTKEGYDKNIQANEKTLQVIAIYERYLEQCRERIEKSLKNVAELYGVSENTYATVRNADSLLASINGFEVDKLLSLEVPELRIFENAELAGKFDELTQKLVTK